MNFSNLAIVIPAYKIEFLRETIESIANQTCKKFTLYIGDDYSPYNLYNVIKEYENKIRIVYKKYKFNLGTQDLAAHWNRCIEMIGNEEWIWLFSDDDLMELNCVELFYNYIDKHSDVDLLHFNVDIINELGSELMNVKSFPESISSSEFFFQRITSDLNSFAIEYIFKKRIYDSEGKFQLFDLGWCSDDATWIKFSKYTGIKTLYGAKVKWRYSGLNLSSFKGDKDIIIRKLGSSVAYMNWVNNFFLENNVKDKTTEFEKVVWIIQVLIDTSALSFYEKNKYALQCLGSLKYSDLNLLILLYMFYAEMKRQIKNFAMRIKSFSKWILF